MDAILKKVINKVLVIFNWLLLSTGTVIAGTVIYFYLFQSLDHGQFVSEQKLSIVQSSQNSSSPSMLVTAVIESEDARAALIAQFLARHNSPMQPYEFYGQKLVEIADRYQLDFRLLPAIAMQESNLCKNQNPKAPRNCLGFGIHKSGTLDFDSYEAGFERAGRELKAYYIDKGLLTVEQIESKYTPSSNGSWANSVNQWMAEIRFDDRQMGRENQDNASVVEFAK